MLKLPSTILSLMLLPLTLVVTQSRTTDGEWKVKAPQARCLVMYKDKYIDAVRDGVVIVNMKTCPDADQDRVARAFVSDSDLPPPAKHTNEFEQILVYSLDDLRCLGIQHIRFEGATAWLPKSLVC